ncbi:MAG: hypothetical protein JSV80_11395 [Acidobacteriota bacterium]|nr:MAG: hypothetical protein JSV80_11395 [Acidobacteriota bacterium]
MSTLGLIGVSARRHGADALAAFTLPREQAETRILNMKKELGVEELVYVATCNRVEVAFRSGDDRPLPSFRPLVYRSLRGEDPTPGEAERGLRIWGGEGAVEHVFLVAAGLDSSQLGEREIRSQIREALKLARGIGTSGPLLDHVFDSALKVAARIHERMQSHGRHTSLGDLAADHLIERLRETPGRAALIGVSPMTRRAARRLAEEDLPFTVVNRTLARAAELAAEFAHCGAEAAALDAFRERPVPVEAVLLAVASPEPVLGRPELERLAARAPSGHSPLIIDMGIPPNVDVDAARHVDVDRVDMKRIADEAEASRKLLLMELAPARMLVDRGLEDFRRSLAERFMAPVIAGLNQRYRQTAEKGVERLFSKDLRHMDPQVRDAVGRWAEVLARRFAHIPTKGLRTLASELGAEAVRLFLEGADASELMPSPDADARQIAWNPDDDLEV